IAQRCSPGKRQRHRGFEAATPAVSACMVNKLTADRPDKAQAITREYLSWYDLNRYRRHKTESG
ncbi:hypothetical protein, partial [Klebsiella aerogenes]|uniref:hypothetical protein n=1 Tax=Klebsiella aerogenes TaxID=548 RepID=UPI0019D3ABC7